MHDWIHLMCMFSLCPALDDNLVETSGENQGCSLIQSKWNVGKTTLHNSRMAIEVHNSEKNVSQPVESDVLSSADGQADQVACRNDARPLEEGHIPNPSPLTRAREPPARRSLSVARIFYINEDRSDDRREAMERRLSQQEFLYSRFSAINQSTASAGDLLNKPLCPFKAEDTHTNLSTYACAQSHLEVYRKIVREDPHGRDAYLILEDDALLTEGWYEKLKSMLPLVPADATALILGAEGLADCKDAVAPGIFLATHPSYSKDASGNGRNWYLGSLGTLVWPQTLPRLIRKIEHQDFACHSDVNLLSAGDARSYALLPPLVLPAGFASTMNR
mmetsp:Transcript_17721/g.32621  ORF Transcript_17721/g.32621 Transcript_17721/m.32621 type:complete len:333 (-) Transcript_17721:275-1273(-)